MRTHARYELQQGESAGSMDETRTDSPLSVGSGLITSRSVSSESTEPPPAAVAAAIAAPPPPPPPAANKPPSPMDTEEDKAPRQQQPDP